MTNDFLNNSQSTSASEAGLWKSSGNQFTRPARKRSGRSVPPGMFATAGIAFVATLVLGLFGGCVYDWITAPRAAAPAAEGAPPSPAADEPASAPAAEAASTASRSSLASLRLPTDRTDLFDAAVTNAYVPTNDSIPETALYGSARTGSDGRSRFHKGIDIAPVLPRSRQGEATDPVYAIADGRVLYVNRVPGNSSYGAYVVLMHQDPVGDVYSLYAHLASVGPAVRAGAAVEAGDVLGVMGRSSNSRIPPWRAHLHFEMGLMMTQHFAEWERATKQTPLRGNGHGWNLLPADPREVLRTAVERRGSFSMLDWLRSQPAACAIALHLDALPDYFRRHAPLWTGAPFPQGGADVVLGLSDAGLILFGRLATPAESALIAALPAKGTRVAVLHADESLLGRNGMRIVVKDRGTWRFGTNQTAQRWLELLRR